MIVVCEMGLLLVIRYGNTAAGEFDLQVVPSLLGYSGLTLSGLRAVCEVGNARLQSRRALAVDHRQYDRHPDGHGGKDERYDREIEASAVIDFRIAARRRRPAVVGA